MKILRILFGQQIEEREGDVHVSAQIDEAARKVAEQERRLQRIRHLRRERDLYDRRRRESPG